MREPFNLTVRISGRNWARRCSGYSTVYSSALKPSYYGDRPVQTYGEGKRKGRESARTTMLQARKQKVTEIKETRRLVSASPGTSRVRRSIRFSSHRDPTNPNLIKTNQRLSSGVAQLGDNALRQDKAAVSSHQNQITVPRTAPPRECAVLRPSLHPPPRRYFSYWAGEWGWGRDGAHDKRTCRSRELEPFLGMSDEWPSPSGFPTACLPEPLLAAPQLGSFLSDHLSSETPTKTNYLRTIPVLGDVGIKWTCFGELMTGNLHASAMHLISILTVRFKRLRRELLGLTPRVYTRLLPSAYPSVRRRNWC
jgi:hypothetical protein